jgi:hypothetical protein
MKLLTSTAQLCILALGAMGMHAASAMTALADADLQSVRGAGIAFNLQDFSFTGDVSLTYDGGNGQTIALKKLTLSRSDDPATTFSDPYTMNVSTRVGAPDVVKWTAPVNANGLLKWQFATDWSIGTSSSVFEGGSLVVQDLQNRGGSFSITSPSVAGQEGVVWGSTVRTDIGSLLIRPNGRGDITNADDAGVTNQLRLQGIHISGADGVSPWVLADVTSQPGIFNAVTEGGQSFLHVGIGWNTDLDTEAPAGKLVIDNISFRNNAETYINPMSGAPSNTLNLGTSSIGSMQIQYLDMKLHAGR